MAEHAAIRMLQAQSFTALPVRRETFSERVHVVLPVVALVEGVHEGSGGPFYYPADEIKASAEYWNGVEVPIMHPEVAGEPVTVNTPATIEEQSVGRVFNAWYDPEYEHGPALRAELWIDEEKVRKVAPAVLDIALAGGKLEVSTGLFSNDEHKPGDWKGEKYQGTIRAIVPDHIALLPGSEGACSWKDGCGVRVNTQREECGCGSGSKNTKEDVTMEKEQIVNALIACERTAFTDEDRAWLSTLEDGQLEKLRVPEPPPKVEEEEKPETPPEEPKAEEAKVETPKPEPVMAEKAKKPVTVDEYIANAPAEIANTLRRAIERDRAVKEGIVESITGNKRCRFSANELRAKSIEELERIAELAQVDVDFTAAAGGPRVNADPNAVPPAPLVFEMKRG